MVTRREFLVTAAAALSTGPLAAMAFESRADAPAGSKAPADAPNPKSNPTEGLSMPYQLPGLPYSFEALEPHIDAKTMEIHHGKHHAAYVANVNKALEGHADLASKDIETLLRDITKVPDAIRQTVINNGGGHANHALFWQIMAPGKGGEPTGDLASAIGSTFGGFAQFKELFSKNAATRFGSGWSWLVVDKDKKLQALSSANQDSPLMLGQTPILGLDVWEHAYYLQYQNRRPDYVAAWWNLVNWEEVARRFAAATR